MDMIGIDVMRPINPRTSDGHQHIIIIVDYVTRYLWSYATRGANGETVL
jgi:hypothetical protein